MYIVAGWKAFSIGALDKVGKVCKVPKVSGAFVFYFQRMYDVSILYTGPRVIGCAFIGSSNWEQSPGIMN